jgi:hypothetical protein
MEGCAVMTKTSKRERASDYELTRNVISEADRAVTARAEDRKRCERCWKMYFPVDGGQWDDADKAVLRAEHRHIAQYDVIGPKIDTLAGSLLADLPDLSWSPVEGQGGAVTEAVAKDYYSDRELYDYDDALLRVFRDGLVHSGDAYLFTDSRYGVKRNRVGREPPGFLVWDPYWQTDDDRDAELVFRFRFLSPERLVQMFGHKSERLLAAIREQQQRAADFPVDTAGQKRRLHTSVGDEYKIIEKHYLKHIKGKRLMGRREGSEEFIPFPVDRDEDFLRVFGDLNGVDWTTVVTTNYEERVHYFTTVCEDLQELLAAEEKSEVQVNGLPFFHFSTRRYEGSDMGIVESMIDAQQTINKRESLITELISKANGGSTFVNENLFLDDAKWQEWQKNANKPGHKERVPLDGVQTPMLHLAANQYPAAVLDQLGRMFDKVIPLVSRVSESMNSIADSGDSGILYERKYQVNLIALTMINRSIRRFVNNIGEAYFYQWQNNNKDVTRTVELGNGNAVVLNNTVGGGVVFNSVMDVPRCRVVVTESTKSQTYQMRYRSIWSEVMKSIPPDAAPGQFLLVMKLFFDTLQMKDEDREVLNQLNEMMMVQAKVMGFKNLTALQTAIQNDTLQSKQIQQQLDQMVTQMQQRPPEGWESQGAPQEGGSYAVQMPPEAGGEMGLPQENQPHDPRVNYTQTPDAPRIRDVAPGDLRAQPRLV